MATKKKAAKKTASPRKRAGAIDNCKIRMYCLGTGDCFVLKYYSGATEKFTMMIDCGSCQGTPADFAPYIDNLANYVNNHIDLLVITHEHNDHVNGFAKCEDVFKDPALTINEAWFAWTENPDDPGGLAKKLQEKRKKMRMALASAINEYKLQAAAHKNAVSDDYYKLKVDDSHAAFLNGLETLATINLSSGNAVSGASLPGMAKIKAILKNKKTDKGKKTVIQYLSPGQSISVDKLDGFIFHVLGPPSERDFIFKDGKEGADVYKKKLNFYESTLSATAFLSQGKSDIRDKDIPFDENYIVNERKPSLISRISNQTVSFQSNSNPMLNSYQDKTNAWRKIDADWLNSAGSLALRLNSHINNTSLALAIEAQGSKKVMLFPGDAEYGSWESWHSIENWKNKGKGGVHFVQDLLSRTVFYKVGHHLSYNGTALKLGIEMMPTSGMTAMATLDRGRIASKWKSTMPNSYLMQELIRRCEGRLFIMDEKEIRKGPSKTLDPAGLAKSVYEAPSFPGKKAIIYKQFTCKL